MKLCRSTITLCAMVLIMAEASSTFAQTPSAPATGTWTKEDVQKLCDNRWKIKKPRQIPTCLKNHNPKIGKPKTPADQQEIDTGKMPSKAKKTN